MRNNSLNNFFFHYYTSFLCWFLIQLYVNYIKDKFYWKIRSHYLCWHKLILKLICQIFLDKEKPVSWSAERLPMTLDCLSHEPGLYYNKGHGHISIVFLCLVYNATTNSYMVLKIIIKRETLGFHTLLNLSLLISWGCVLTLTQVIWPRSRSLHHQYGIYFAKQGFLVLC